MRPGGKVKYRIEISLISLTFFFLGFNAWAQMTVQACFSPIGQCSTHILREIGQAQKEILVAVYAFTSDELAWALIRARQRGINVRVIVDQEFDAGSENSKGKFLAERGLSLRRLSGLRKGGPNGGAGLMHQKFAVIDRKVVLTGSYNWTASADRFNDENLLFFRDAGPLAEEYRREFFRLWDKKG